MNRILLTLLSLTIAWNTTRAADPNVIIIFADDQGYQDLGCFGSPTIKTPNIDNLATQGIRFTDFYSGYCVCSASRASLLTGSYQSRLSMPGVLGPRSKVGLHPDEVTIADLLKQKEYATCMIGKWHVGDKPETLPASQGFDYYFGLPYSNDMARQKGWGNNPEDLDKIWRMKKYDIYDNEIYRNREIIEKPVNQVTLTDRYTDEAIRFITANQDKPFYLHFCHAMPHVPLFVNDARFDPDPHQAYRLTIEHMDHSVGRITETLDELGIADNTLIIYTSDNGPWLSKKHHGGSALPLRAGKATTFEGGMRVPCVMRWPAKFKGGQTCNQVAATIDVFPTLAKITGQSLPKGRPIDGRDITGLLTDVKSSSPHEEEGYYYYRNGRVEAVRIGDFKLHFKKPTLLYNLRKDIAEEVNLAGKMPDMVASMTQTAVDYHEKLTREKRPIWREAAAVKP
ncbi:MAG: sulfatase [Planctomycetota bacterium]|nr:sulfatase [Planctomycetota bacterium]